MFDISEIGSILCQVNLDEDEYEEYLSEHGVQDSPEVLKEFMREYCDYDVSYLDSEYFHDMGKYDRLTIQDISDNFGEKIAEAVLNDCMDEKEHDFEIQAYQEETIDVNNPQEVNKYAVKYLPHGEYFKGCRGFLLTDGNIIYTDSEHNQCSRIPGIRGTFHFIELGNIRLTQDGIDVAKYPTPQQLDKLVDIIYNYQGQTFYLSLLNKSLGIKSRAYGTCDIDEVINDIKNYFYGNLREGRKIVRINEKQMKKIIESTLLESIEEGGTNMPSLYHFTNINAIVSITRIGHLKTSHFQRGTRGGDYMSLTRHKSNLEGFAKARELGARIEIDTTRLNSQHGVSTTPYEYYSPNRFSMEDVVGEVGASGKRGYEYYKNNYKSEKDNEYLNQAEESVVRDGMTIPASVIKRVDILYEKNMDGPMRELAYQKYSAIPRGRIFVYMNPKDFNLQTNKCLPIVDFVKEALPTDMEQPAQVAENKNMKLNENTLRKIIKESIKRILNEMDAVHDALYSLGEKAKSVIDYLYNEGVVAYDDEHLAQMANDMSKIDFEDICHQINFEFGLDLSDEESKALERYLTTGSYPELEDQILRAVREYEKEAHQYMNP